MTATARERVVGGLRAAISDGRALLATGAGSGLAAASAERGGADLVVVYNSGRFRTAGHGSLAGMLPYGDANAIVLDLAREVLSAVRSVPVVAGVCGTDPLRDMGAFVRRLAGMGVAGIQNFPSVGLIDGRFRHDLEATGIGFEQEVDLMRVARRAGLLTCAFVTDVDGARRMALAGVDVLAAHLGVTRLGEDAGALERAAVEVQLIADAARALRDDVLVLFHGGAAGTPADVQAILYGTDGVDGFFAASSVERMPVAQAVEEAARSFTELRTGRGDAATGRPPTAPDFGRPAPKLALELTPQTLPAYLHERGLLEADENVEVEELGGGVSNVVLMYRASGRCGVVKQSRPRLRVAQLWLSDVRRVLNERDAIQALAGELPPGSVPTLTFSDDEIMAFGMECAPAEAPLWKPLLLAGELEPARAGQAGRLLRRIHDCTRDEPRLARRFVSRPLIEQNRLDPWYRATAERHPEQAEAILYAAERVVEVERVLVHGDYVPKNMFLLDAGLLLLDYEVVHFGNPGYDVATFINHMLLKGLRFPEYRRGFLGLAGAFWEAYADGLPDAERALAEDEAVLQLGALMLARIDGKSPVEYLVDHPGAEEGREIGRWLLRTRPALLRDVFLRYAAPADRVPTSAGAR